MNVLSVFDGMSCGQIALKELGIKVNRYYASEIDKHAIIQTKHNFPNTIQLGSVTDIKAKDLDKIDLFIGGSPCQGFSFAGKQLNFNDPRSALFFEYVRLWKEIKAINPNAKFLLENVNMKKEYLRVISEYLGVFPVRINSNLVSAQNRDRLYWTNIRTKDVGLFAEKWTDIPQPKDKGILLKDILQPESEIADKFYLSNKIINHFTYKRGDFDKRFKPINNLNIKANCVNVSTSKMVVTDNYICVSMVGRKLDTNGKRKDNDKNIKAVQRLETAPINKTNCLTTVAKDNLITNGYKLRRLTPLECSRLQTIPEWYIWKCSDTQIYRMLGNGWTVEVIKHILNYL